MASQKSHTHKAKMVEALKKCHGIVTDAAKMIDIAPKSHYRWLKDDPKYKSECAEASEQAIDFVEGELYSLIAEHNPAAIIFYMKTKGRNRGYIEKQIIDTTIHDKRINIVVKSTKQQESIAQLN